MNAEHPIPPLRDLPPGRLVARRQHLLAEIGARPRLRTPQRTALLAAAVLAVGAAAVPALGLGRPLVEFFAGEPAPQATQQAFASLDEGAPAGMAPGVSGPARSVLHAVIDGRDTTLWVAPTRQGGFCVLLEGFGGGCDRDRSLPLSFGIGRFTEAGPQEVNGDVLGTAATSVRIDFEDGQTVTVPLTTVSPPIGAGFFVFEIPAAHRLVGHRPTSLTALTADGSTLATQDLPFVVPSPPTSTPPGSG